MEEKVPIITECFFKLDRKKEDQYVWNCEFKLANDDKNYKCIIFVEKFEEENNWCWDSSHVQIKEDEKWIFFKRDNETDDHIFEQCVNIIKKHSKYRLRLLSITEKFYHDDDFKPFDYPFPPKIEKEEENPSPIGY